MTYSTYTKLKMPKMAKEAEIKKLILLSDITEKINRGKTFDDVFDIIYEKLSEIVPYNRIGVALVDEEADKVTLMVARSDGEMHLKPGYSGRIKGSSLERLIRYGETRIINDLKEYLDKKPTSDATRLVIKEGMASNLTLPLLIEGKPTGVIFFSSRETDTYTTEHELYLKLISGHIAITLEKGRMIEELERRNKEITYTYDMLKSAQDELVKSESLAAVGELAATIAHEIKNPLAGISGAIQVIGNNIKNDDPQKEIVAEILSQVKRLDDTVRDLLIFARPQKIERGQVDLVELIEKVYQFLKTESIMKDIKFKIEPHSPITISADPHLLQQVLMNIIQNAAHSMTHGGNITIAVEERIGNIQISIRDTGTGIHPANMERIFRPFFSTKVRGTGLGLAISRKIMEAHGGRINIESEFGKGTTVYLNFTNIER